MAGSGGRLTDILGRLRNKRNARGQRHAEKARVQGEAKAQWQVSGDVVRPVG